MKKVNRIKIKTRPKASNKMASGGDTAEVGSSVLSGAASGFSVAGPWGAVGGAVIQGGLSLMGINSREKAMEEEKKRLEEAKRAALTTSDTASMANFAGGNGNGINVNALYAGGGEPTGLKTGDITPKTGDVAPKPTVDDTGTYPGTPEHLKYDLARMGYENYNQVMKANVKEAAKITKLIRSTVLANPENFKDYYHMDDAGIPIINFNALIPKVLPGISGTVGFVGNQSGQTAPEPFKMPSTFGEGGESNPTLANPNGGIVMPVASNAGIALGQTHEQGGIAIGNNTEVENNETLIKNKEGNVDVFSHRLGFANQANQLAIEKGKLETKASLYVTKITQLLKDYDNAQDIFKRNGDSHKVDGNHKILEGIISQIDMIDKSLTDLFNKQEAQNGRMENNKAMLALGGIVKMKLGGSDLIAKYRKLSDSMFPMTDTKIPYPNPRDNSNLSTVPSIAPKVDVTPQSLNFDNVKTTTDLSVKTPIDNNKKLGKIASAIAPFIDNIGNFFANENLKKMDVPSPILAKAQTLDPNIDVSASMNAIDTAALNTKKFIEANSSNSSIARDMIQSVNNQVGLNKAGIIEKKNNQELSIRQSNLGNIQNVDNANAQTLNQHAQEVFAKNVQTGITNPSENLANIESNVKDAISQKNTKDYQDKQLGLYKDMTPKGVWDDIEPAIHTTTATDYAAKLKAMGRSDSYIQDRIAFLTSKGIFK